MGKEDQDRRRSLNEKEKKKKELNEKPQQVKVHEKTHRYKQEERNILVLTCSRRL